MADPMHQFEVTKIVDLPDFALPGVGVIDMAITNSTVAMAIAAGLVVAFFALASGGVAVILGIPGAALALGGVVALTALEFLVAFLQAFVFAVLTCVYLNDAVHAGHH